MPQTAHADADLDVGGWTTAPLYSKIDETDPDTSDYVSSTGGAAACNLNLEEFTFPNLTRGLVYFRVMARQSGLPSGTLTIVFKADSSTIFTWVVYPPSDFTSFTRSFTNDELALVSDWTILTCTLAYAGTGTCDVCWLEVRGEGTVEQMGEPIDEADMEAGGYCALKGYWYPGSQLMEVDGRRVNIKTRQEPDTH